jgi:hypothetical protein
MIYDHLICILRIIYKSLILVEDRIMVEIGKNKKNDPRRGSNNSSFLYQIV